MPAGFDYNRSCFPAGITDPGYNAAGASYQIARFVYEISFIT